MGSTPAYLFLTNFTREAGHRTLVLTANIQLGRVFLKRTSSCHVTASLLREVLPSSFPSELLFRPDFDLVSFTPKDRGFGPFLPRVDRSRNFKRVFKAIFSRMAVD